MTTKRKQLRVGIVLSDGSKDVIALSGDGQITADWAEIARLKDEWEAGTGETEAHRLATLIWYVRNS